MLEVFCLIIITGLFFYLDEKKAIFLFVCIIPFHSFLKQNFVYFFGGGDLFSYWKEIAVVILFLRFYRRLSNVNSGFLILICFYFVFILLIFFGSPHIGSGFPKLRDQIFPFLFMILISVINYQGNGYFKKFAIWFSIIILIHGVMGIGQKFFFNIPISTLMGLVDFVDADGYIQYATVSSRIMGFERMAGIVGEGPNGFGLFMAFSINFLNFLLINARKFRFFGKQRHLIILALIVSVLCLILSFSRAGWAIVILGFIAMAILFRIRIRLSIIFFSVVSFSVLLTTLFFTVPKVQQIIVSSFTGKEDSANARGKLINSGIDKVINEPIPHGLGTTDIRSPNYEFFTESAFTNITYEVGIIGFLFLIVLYLKLFFILKNNIKNYNSIYSIFSLSILIPSLIASFVSINPYGIPYIYLWSFAIGLGLNKSLLLSSFLDKKKYYQRKFYHKYLRLKRNENINNYSNI